MGIVLWHRDTLVSVRAPQWHKVKSQWCNLYSYYKSAVFICIHKAYQEKFPDSVTNDIIERPGWYTLYEHFIVHPVFQHPLHERLPRSQRICNYLTSKHRGLITFSYYRNLELKLKSLDVFKNLTFKVTSASTCPFWSDLKMLFIRSADKVDPKISQSAWSLVKCTFWCIYLRFQINCSFLWDR